MEREQREAEQQRLCADLERERDDFQRKLSRERVTLQRKSTSQSQELQSQLAALQDRVDIEVDAQVRLKRYLERQRQALEETRLQLVKAKDNQKSLESQIATVKEPNKTRVRNSNNPANAARKRAEYSWMNSNAGAGLTKKFAGRLLSWSIGIPSLALMLHIAVDDKF